MSLPNLFLAPFVVAARLPKLALEATDGNATNPEADRMVQEKVAAGVAGLFAAQRSWINSNHDIVRASLRGDFASASVALLRAAPRAAEASLKPAAQTVSANLKRLGKRAR
jgi:hypothetical protein